jgi:hypothetical protein
MDNLDYIEDINKDKQPGKNLKVKTCATADFSPITHIKTKEC